MMRVSSCHRYRRARPGDATAIRSHVADIATLLVAKACAPIDLSTMQCSGSATCAEQSGVRKSTAHARAVTALASLSIAAYASASDCHACYPRDKYRKP